MINQKHTITLAFIGGGNMASALSAGLIGKRCAAEDILVIDPNEQVREKWQQQGTHTAEMPQAQLAHYRIWVLAVKPQHMKKVLQQCQPFIQPDTLIVSVAAGITATAIAERLGFEDQPHQRVIRCMPNTPALIGCGMTGLLALDAVDEDDKAIAEYLFKTVGEYVWVESDEAIDAVTALSGSGPAYVFLFLESLIQAGQAQGLSLGQAKKLALATVKGATELAALSPLPLDQLRENVTSEGGTTAAALAVFKDQNFSTIVQQAMDAAKQRAAELAQHYS